MNIHGMYTLEYVPQYPGSGFTHGSCQVLASSDSSLVILAQFIFGINGGYIWTLSLSTSTWLGRVVMGVDFPHTHGVILPTSAVFLRVSESSGGNNVTT